MEGSVLSGPDDELALAAHSGFRTERQAAQNDWNRVDFITWTHGGWSSSMVSLDEAGAEDEVLASWHDLRISTLCLI